MRERIGCFSCNRTVDWGEYFICISRLRRIRSEQGDDEIVNAMASLQVCIYCVARAQFDSITIHNEVPLLELEKAGFYWFARRLAGNTEPWALSTGEHSCTLCRSAIKEGDCYTQIEISEEVAKHEGGIEVIPESISKLATICDSCAKKYMVWWYDTYGNIIDVA